MERKENVLDEISFDFAVKTVKLYKKIIKEEKEYVLPKQFLRSGTSIGANVAEANGAISTADFSSKVSIAYKESLETKFWLRLFEATNYIEAEEFQDMFEKADELSRIMFSILKKTRMNK
ncbi:four helix bundle protein [Salinimicrobium sp. MT39]|uniref:Four helix bundle protein n=1 Tax=Salinimicrobium profundisediminis TaxID=2994553 RepID=A0A9X3I136_9FLAO|nr:four helix bundle protein [Salinimicrobium profundisediminis]MCX2838174.1 four helix bundle protein [Salinimicrobium profundisediminis]